ncbi:MAG TPA: outer membrane beta-barrel protein [Terracidiphilus sp.]|nr:outer membrane beta-barrel protein [Terracidiphilus sp.]
MRMKGTPASITLIAAAALSAAAALGQQTDLSGSFYKTFNASTSGNDTQQTTTNSSGGVAGWRQIRSPLVGYEMSFAFNPEDQTLSPQKGACGLLCQNKPTPLTVRDLEIAGDWIASVNFGAFRPFVLGGLGVMIFAPSNGALDTNTVARVAYVGGGGADIRLQPRFGLRLQYRESFYKAPDLLPVYPSTGKYTPTGEPMAGVYIRLGPLPKAH